MDTQMNSENSKILVSCLLLAKMQSHSIKVLWKVNSLVNKQRIQRLFKSYSKNKWGSICLSSRW